MLFENNRFQFASIEERIFFNTRNGKTRYVSVNGFLTEKEKKTMKKKNFTQLSALEFEFPVSRTKQTSAYHMVLLMHQLNGKGGKY